MNRNYILIISSALVIVLAIVLVYLMFFGSGSNEQDGEVEGSGSFTEFVGLGDDAPNQVVEGEGGANDTGVNTSIEETANPRLRQLTDRIVVGYQEMVEGGLTRVYFMESGVGHIYLVDVENGNEERVSAITIPNARRAEFSDSLSHVAVLTGSDTGTNPLQLGEIDLPGRTTTLEVVSEQVADFTITSDDYLLYSTPTNNSQIIRSMDLETGESEVVFTIPFREAKLIFGDTVAGDHFFYPKTSAVLEGFLYQYSNGVLQRLPVDGFGFSANQVGTSLLATFHKETLTPRSVVFTPDTGVARTVDTSLIPSKCTDSGETMYCAHPEETQLKHDSIVSWLQGTQTFSDDLWEVGTEKTKLFDLEVFSQQIIDVVNPTIGMVSNNWYFQNKLDSTLWVYELGRDLPDDTIEL